MAVTRWTITTPQYLKPFLKLNRKRPVFDRIRPHNFLLVAHTDHPPPGYDDKPFLLVAPFEPDRGKWRRLEWINAHDGTRWRPITEQEAKRRSDVDALVVFPGEVIVKTYRDVLDLYRTHAEPKSLGPDGKRCDRETIGQLTRRHVVPFGIRYIGKESNKLEEREAGLVGADDALNEYRNSEHDPFAQLAVPALRKLADELKLTIAQIAAGAGVSERTVERARASKLTGTTARAIEARAKLTAYTLALARAQLRAACIRRPPDREALLATYLDRQTAQDPEPRLCACGCGQPLPAGTRGRPRKYIDEAHRKRAQRRQR